ncbi:MAG: MqnA/MqnD/SBP family protein [Acidobacteriota bacterium]
MQKETVRIAHSPDSDDAFMFYALATDKIESNDFRFVHELRDIESLNRLALNGEYEITAVSIHAYAYLHKGYALLNSGASMGDGYGPRVVSRASFGPEELRGKRVAVPGERTSAFLALKLLQPDIESLVVPFDEIIACVKAGTVDAGVVIHEGQLTYRDHDLHKVVDLGEWWKQETGLPLPLGGNAIRRDLGAEKIQRLAGRLEASIRFALDNREEALNYALQFGRGLDSENADRFISMYVNDRTLDYGEEGRQAVQLFLDRGYEAGLIPDRVKVDFVRPELSDCRRR